MRSFEESTVHEIAMGIARLIRQRPVTVGDIWISERIGRGVELRIVKFDRPLPSKRSVEDVEVRWVRSGSVHADDDSDLLGVLNINRNSKLALDPIVAEICKRQRAEEMKDLRAILNQLLWMRVPEGDVRQVLDEVMVSEVMES